MSDNDTAHATLRAIRRILRKTSEQSRQFARVSGLTVPQVLCLRAIAEAEAREEVTVAKVSQAVQLSPATVSRILDRLEKAGLLVRERRSQDRRKVCLSLTTAGRQKLQMTPKPLQHEFVAKLRKLPAQEQAQLLTSLEQVVELLEASNLDASPLLDSEVEV